MDRGDVQEREMLALRKGMADPETLIDTPPLDVVVFDARSGAPVSVNRADGREASLKELSPGAGCGGLVWGQVSDADGDRIGSDGTSTQRVRRAEDRWQHSSSCTRPYARGALGSDELRCRWYRGPGQGK